MRNESSVWAILPIAIALAILSNLFVYYAFSLVRDNPEYETFCPYTSEPAPETREACEARDGIWSDYAEFERPTAVDGQSRPIGYCDLHRKCSETFQDAQEDYRSELFVVFLIAGTVLLALSRLKNVTRAIFFGLSYGGVLAVIIAGFNAWSAAGEVFRLFLIALALGVLVWIGLKKFDEK